MQVDSENPEQENAAAVPRQADSQLRLVVDTIPVLAWCHGADGASEFFNQRWHDFTGLSMEEARGWGWTVTIHPEDLPRLMEVWEKLRLAKSAGGLEVRMRRFDGAYRWFLLQAAPLFDHSGELARWYGASTDIDDRKRAEALLTGENKILEMIAGGSSLPEILDSICRFVDEFSGDGVAIILVLDGDGKHLRWGAGPKIPEAIVAIVDGIEIGDGVGSCASAAYRKEQVIATDIATDPQWANFRSFSSDHGLRSGWSTPVLASDGSVLGTFGIYWQEPRSPTAEHQVVIKNITHLTAVAIERKRAAETLRASEKYARAQADVLTQALDAMALESSPERIAEHVLRTMVQQMDGHSSAVWLKDEATDSMQLQFTMGDGQFARRADSSSLSKVPSLRLGEIKLWAEVLDSGAPYFVDDIDECPNPHLRAQIEAPGVNAILLVPMKVSGEAAGMIGIRFPQRRNFRKEEVDLAQALANQAMLALKFTSLSARSRQVAVIEERNRMARDIHDTLAQGFTGVIVQLEAAEEAAAQDREDTVSHHIDRAGEIARESLREARRSVQALRPLALEEKSLREAWKDLNERMTAGTEIQTAFTWSGEAREVAPEWEANLLRIGQEALTNVLRHAQASEFQVHVVFETDSLQITLRDNGRGFDSTKSSEGFGLLGMRERTENMGGSLTVQSESGSGTLILIKLPIPAMTGLEKS